MTLAAGEFMRRGTYCRAPSNASGPLAAAKTLEALTAQMETLARHGPVLMIFEDAHWTDFDGRREEFPHVK